MNWIMEHTVHNGFAGVTVGEQIFTDLYYADDVALLCTDAGSAAFVTECDERRGETAGTAHQLVKNKDPTNR